MSMHTLAEEEGMSNFLQTGGPNDNMPRVTIASSRGSEHSQPNVLRTVYLPNEKVG